MEFFKFPQPIRKAIAGAMVISAIAGGIAGGLLGAIYTSYSFSFATDAYVQSLNSSSAPSTQVVIEDSAAIDVVKEASPAVVSIVVTQDLSKLYNRTGPFSPFDNFFFFGYPYYQEPPSGKRQTGGGTGFIITTDGMIVTNRHVVDEEDAEYTIVLNNGTQYEAKVLARDSLNDIAVIKIEADNLPVLDLGNSDSIQIGQTVIAIGNSLGEYSNTVTKGVISGINRRVEAGDGAGFSELIEEAIQTDAAINPGNSGGPLLDLFGKVIGVNTAVSREGQLIGFAISINSVKNVIDSVRQYGRIVRPFLGVRYILLNEEIAKANNITGVGHGALIVRGQERTDLAVVPGSPADKAGLVENDIILEVSGEQITQDRGLARLIDKYKPGDVVKLKILHKGEEKEVDVTLKERE